MSFLDGDLHEAQDAGGGRSDVAEESFRIHPWRGALFRCFPPRPVPVRDLTLCLKVGGVMVGPPRRVMVVVPPRSEELQENGQPFAFELDSDELPPELDAAPGYLIGFYRDAAGEPEIVQSEPFRVRLQGPRVAFTPIDGDGQSAA
jgi:hypothetical protein